MDEFCSTLDRDTAKIVAFNVQKLARKLGKAVVAATTHTDLSVDLRPSVHIHKRFGKEIQVKYLPDNSFDQWRKFACILLKEMQVEEGSYEDWKKVAGFHYRSHRVAFMQKIFVLKRKDWVCGAIVYVHPMSAAPCRERVLKIESMKELNEKVSRVARVVVHPKYRTIGAGVKLVHDSLPGNFSYPYNRRIAGQHGHFTMEDYREWLKRAERNDLARALRRLAQLNQSKVYLFWKRSSV